MALRYLICSPGSKLYGPVVRLCGCLREVLRDSALRAKAANCTVLETRPPPLPENRMNNFPHVVCVITPPGLIYVQTKDTRQFDSCHSIHAPSLLLAKLRSYPITASTWSAACAATQCPSHQSLCNFSLRMNGTCRSWLLLLYLLFIFLPRGSVS